jgi:hypothetical protein
VEDYLSGKARKQQILHEEMMFHSFDYKQLKVILSVNFRGNPWLDKNFLVAARGCAV